MSDSVLGRVGLFCGGLVGGLLVGEVVRRGRGTGDEVPLKWVEVGRVCALTIYPVKSLPGIPVQSATVTPIGLKGSSEVCRDRIFMVTNDKGNFQNLRQFPIFTRIQTRVEGDSLRLSLLDEPDDTVLVPLPLDNASKRRLARVWGDKVSCVDCGDEVGAWLSRVASTPGLRLVYHSSQQSQRKVQPSQARFQAFSPKDTGTFHDETSYMLMTEESLGALNERVEKPFSVRAFRPTIFIHRTPAPWAEDLWTFVKIGEGAVFKASMPCQRCKITTMDPDTGEVREDGEPIKALNSLKRDFGDSGVGKLVEKAAIMGAHFGLLSGQGSPIAIGDPIYAALK